MAGPATGISRVVVPLNDVSDAVTAGEVLKTDDYIPVDVKGEKDIRTLFRIETTISGGDEITIVGGNGDKGVPNTVVAVDGVAYIWLDSAYFMQVSGTDAGCILFISKNATSSYKTKIEAVTIA